MNSKRVDGNIFEVINGTVLEFKPLPKDHIVTDIVKQIYVENESSVDEIRGVKDGGLPEQFRFWRKVNNFSKKGMSSFTYLFQTSCCSEV